MTRWNANPEHIVAEAESRGCSGCYWRVRIPLDAMCINPAIPDHIRPAHKDQLRGCTQWIDQRAMPTPNQHKGRE